MPGKALTAKCCPALLASAWAWNEVLLYLGHWHSVNAPEEQGEVCEWPVLKRADWGKGRRGWAAAPCSAFPVNSNAAKSRAGGRRNRDMRRIKLSACFPPSAPGHRWLFSKSGQCLCSPHLPLGQGKKQQKCSSTAGLSCGSWWVGTGRHWFSIWVMVHVCSHPVLPNPMKTSSECPLCADQAVDQAECVRGCRRRGRRRERRWDGRSRIENYITIWLEKIDLVELFNQRVRS